MLIVEVTERILNRRFCRVGFFVIKTNKCDLLTALFKLLIRIRLVVCMNFIIFMRKQINMTTQLTTYFYLFPFLLQSKHPVIGVGILKEHNANDAKLSSVAAYRS